MNPARQSRNQSLATKSPRHKDALRLYLFFVRFNALVSWWYKNIPKKTFCRIGVMGEISGSLQFAALPRFVSHSSFCILTSQILI
jgi:hypothetical protein